MHTAHKLVLGLLGGDEGGYDPDAFALLAAMSVPPDESRRALINSTILSLKTAGIWSLLDELWFMAAHDAQAGRLGWKRYKDITLSGTLTFTQDEGYAGNGVNSYINTNFSPRNDGVAYTLNSASLGIYCRTNSQGIGIAASVFAAESTMVVPRDGTNLFVSIVNDNSAPGANVSNTDSRGFFVGRRPNSGVVQGYKNGTQAATANIDSTAMPEIPLYIGAQNSSGVASNHNANQYAFAFFGASMSTQQQADLYDIVQAYMTAVGADI